MTLLPRFEQFIKERKFLANVSPATVSWRTLLLPPGNDAKAESIQCQLGLKVRVDQGNHLENIGNTGLATAQVCDNPAFLQALCPTSPTSTLCPSLQRARSAVMSIRLFGKRLLRISAKALWNAQNAKRRVTSGKQLWKE